MMKYLFFILMLGAPSAPYSAHIESQCCVPEDEVIAFPGAEGFGRFAKGGRGGAVIEVTNLNDSGTGSLRACVEASGPRTCVFRVGGTIALEDRLTVTNPYLTIAGQTAPGDGIAVKGMTSIRAHNVIVRYIRLRAALGLPNPSQTDALQITGFGLPENTVRDIMIDHTSISWGSDETANTFTGTKNITYQWSIISEGLLGCGVPDACKGRGFLTGGGATDLTMHHNLLAHHNDRNPYVTSGNEEYVNNVVYNYKAPANIHPAHGVIKMNAVGNYYLRGSDSNVGDSGIPFKIWGQETFSTSSGIYVEGNIEPVSRPNNSLPENDIIQLKNGGFPEVFSRFNFPTISTTDAFTARDEVLNKAGVTFPIRDSVDTRIVNDVINVTGTYRSTPEDFSLQSGTPPIDTDKDGMPDAFEASIHLDPNDPRDGNGDHDGDGWTNLEEYLHSLVE